MLEYENKSDEEIVGHVQSKDQELYFVIVERYQAKLMRYVKSILKNEVKAQDVVQETFIKAFINLRSFNVKKNFSSWIYRIAHNEALNVIKKNSKETPLLEDFDIESGENLTDNFEKREVVLQVGKCLNQMPILYSEPLVLYFIEDKSYEEISDILRIPMGTVATRINRAKVLMKNLCQKN